MTTQMISLAKITIDDECQQRAMLIEETVEQYSDAMSRGDQFPAVELIQEGDVYWLTDGFHRVAAAKRAGLETIQANISQGEKRDAVWRSFAANSTHGLQRQRGATRRIIKQILQDPEWAKTPMRKIARHVGCSESLVRKTRDELTAFGTQLPQSQGEIEVKTADGREYTLPAQQQNRQTAHGAQLRRIIDQLSSFDVPKKAKRSLIAAIKSLQTVQGIITEDEK